MPIPDGWTKLCKECKGVMHGFCDPNNTPTMAQQETCNRLPRERSKRAKVVK